MEFDIFPPLHPLQLADRDYLMNLMGRQHQIISEFTFTNLFLWRNYYGLYWCEIEGCLYFVCFPKEAHIFLFPPIGDDFIPSLNSILERAKSAQISVEMSRIPEVMLPSFESFLLAHRTFHDKSFESIIQEDRANWDYIYSRADLADMAGKDYANLRKKLNKFKNHYSWRYSPITQDNLGDLRQMQESWCDLRACADDPGLSHENTAILELFDNWADFQLFGGIIYEDFHVVAFAIGEPLNDDTVVIHIEKANPLIEGSYQAIAQEFAAHLDSKYAFINREQDLGDPNLRTAKERLHPIRFQKKFRLTI